MLARCALVWLLLASAGCQQFLPATLRHSSSTAARHWAEGQVALQQGQPERAAHCFEQGLAADPGFAANHLSLAAACMEKGDQQEAAIHLAHFVAAQPNHWKAREYHAELLLRQHRWAEARSAFERYDALAQEAGPEVRSRLVRCHSRLTKIASEEEDPYAEHLHRGIGLYLLGRERLALPDPDGDLSTEGLFCRAAVELRKARRQRPEEARPNWYLYEVWSQLGKRQPAMRSLREAEETALCSYLTPTERRELQWTCLRERNER
jgi:tetratricopeptide (TPR) repeat protein